VNQILCLSLVLSLGSPAYQEREAATLALSRLSPEAYLVWAAKSQDAEIAARGRVLLDAHWWKVAGELMPSKKWPYQPWCDSLPYDYPGRHPLIDDYLGRAGQSCHSISSEQPHWWKYRLATKYLIYDLLKAGKSRQEITVLLDKMVDFERAWILRHKTSYQFSHELLEAAGE